MKGEGVEQTRSGQLTSGFQEGAAETSLCLVLKCRSPLTGHQSSKQQPQQPHRVMTPAWGEERKALSYPVTSKTTKEQSPRSWHSRDEQGPGGPAAGKPCGRRATVGEREEQGICMLSVECLSPTAPHQIHCQPPSLSVPALRPGQEAVLPPLTYTQQCWLSSRSPQWSKCHFPGHAKLVFSLPHAL